ncbi:epoxide hydrolase [Penicillium malachiteum]|uniref:Epoxide hydrolase n=1 Tax=Penicillium malachiteum TaxID=1324776 RepID=A0AAD6MZP9_9EURO|nr:epoxide hydrolase [Penicillium malachiteum]
MSAITHHEVNYADGIKKIHYVASGPVDGPLIFFIHGWPATGITWKAQLEACASVGFRAIAPDMPGYGQSTARREVDDYCIEAIVDGMIALLADTGRKAAVWVGHDWGSGIVSAVALQHPEVVKAMVNMCVPFLTIELGWDALLSLMNRDVYPVDKYEFGQFDYIKNWEENFEKTVEWFDSDIAGVCAVMAQKFISRKDTMRPNDMMALVRKNSGWLGGIPKPPSRQQLGPVALPDDVFESFVSDMEKTGFWPGSAYYLHLDRNAKYNANCEKKVDFPVLFIHARWDMTCETIHSQFPEPMRQNCSNLTEAKIDAAHFLYFEKPREVNAVLLRWLADQVPSEWPGALESEYTKAK